MMNQTSKSVMTDEERERTRGFPHTINVNAEVQHAYLRQSLLQTPGRFKTGLTWDGFVTSRADGGVVLLVARVAVGLVLVSGEALGLEGWAAASAREALPVPRLLFVRDPAVSDHLHTTRSAVATRQDLSAKTTLVHLTQRDENLSSWHVEQYTSLSLGMNGLPLSSVLQPRQQKHFSW